MSAEIQTEQESQQALEQALVLYKTLDRVTDLSVRAKVFADAIRSLYSFEAIDQIASAERDYLRSLPVKIGALGSKISRAGYYRLIKPILMIEGRNAEQQTKQDGSVVLVHRALRWVGLTAEEWAKRNSSDRVTGRLTTDTTPIDPNEYLKTAYSLLRSNDWRLVAVGLIAATGRRPHEIVARGKFQTIADSVAWVVSFTGQGKKRGENPTLEIATLLKPQIVVNALNSLRRTDGELAKIVAEIKQEFADVSEQNLAIDRRTNKILNRVVKEYFGSILPSRCDDSDEDSDKNNTALRASYAALATKRDKGSDSIGGQLLYAATLLGHYVPEGPGRDNKLKSLLTTLGYSDIKIAGDVPLFEHKLTKVSIDPENLNWINSKCADWGCTQPDVIARLIAIYEQQSQNPEPIPTEDSEQVEPEPATETDKKIAELAQQVSTLTAILTGEKPKAEPKPQPAQRPTWEHVDAIELWGGSLLNADGEIQQATPKRSPGATEERIDRAIKAVINFNNKNLGADLSQKWAITNRLIRDLTGANGTAIANRLEDIWAGAIAEHHARHGIAGSFHNRQHHGGQGEKALAEKSIKTFWAGILELDPA